MNSPPISLSDAAIAKLKSILEPGQMLRIAIQGGGCAGMQYQFEIEDKPEGDDLTGSFDGVGVVIDPVSVAYLAGSELDYASSDFSAQFVLKNPKAQTQCGCGKSFAG